MSPQSRKKFPLLIRVVGVAICCWFLAMPASRAQNGGVFNNFFQSLFGSPAKPEKISPSNAPLRGPVHKPQRKARDFVSATSTRSPDSPGGAPAAPSFTVSVLGDSLAVLAAQGLAVAFADKPEISVGNLARDLSGLTRGDYYDWPKTARDLIAQKAKIDVVVIMIGINDLQPMKDGADTLDPLSDKWRSLYAQRVESFVAPFHDAHIPVLWVGLPPMRDERFNGQTVALNEIFRDHAQKAGARYIDIWDAFSDQSGQYAAFGPDVDGQNAKLRTDPNGIYFTKAGSRKLAQFLEPEIRRDFDKTKPQDNVAALPPDIEQEADDINAEIRREMGLESPSEGDRTFVPKPSAGPILSLTARPVSAQGALDDIKSVRSAEIQPRALRMGETSEPRIGRADDFRWPRSN
jgi:uncharacterized protein